MNRFNVSKELVNLKRKKNGNGIYYFDVGEELVNLKNLFRVTRKMNCIGSEFDFGFNAIRVLVFFLTISVWTTR